MAGGFGKRLRPFTLNCPKPMLPLLEQPVLAYILDLLKRHRFFEVVIATHHLPEQIQDYFGDGRHRGMSLQYSVEAMPLGTAGSVKNAQSYLGDEPFLVISGDIVTDINLSQVVRFHRENNALATLALLATPYLYIYDLTVLAIGVAFLLRYALTRGMIAAEAAGLAAVSALLLIYPYVKMQVGLAAALIVAALVAWRATTDHLAAISAPVGADR